MESYLEKIKCPDDLKKLNPSEVESLASEIREFLVESISRSGGHLASNLGTVELTLALHYVFNSPKDVLCWDVGHQTYTHKILTGRKDQISKVRSYGGISGFPKQSESEHDHYNVGHAGTSISQALGESIVRDLRVKKGEDFYSVIAIIGDASIASGMAFEAMNHAGHLKAPMLVILNDNEMSISKNVGALSYSLNGLISTRFYKKSWRRFLRAARWIPLFGPVLERLIIRFFSNMKSIITDNQFFTELGFTYYGPVDGHDVKKLIRLLDHFKDLEKPSVLHVVTKKGKGFSHAENDPTSYHGVRPFKPEEGIITKENGKWPLSEFVGHALAHMADYDPKILTITPAMQEGSGLNPFAERHASRFFDTGIAEQHATALSGSFAKTGKKPFLCVYSTFLQRGFDQVIHDICLMNLPVRIILDRAGVVGGDGETHQGLYDIAYLYSLPNIKILSASNEKDLLEMLSVLKDYNESPIVVRFSRISGNVSEFKAWEKKNDSQNQSKVDIFKAIVLKKGSDIALFAEGSMVTNALQAAKLLEEKNYSVSVINLRSIKPFDSRTIRNQIRNKKGIFTIENHTREGGVGSLFVTEFFNDFKGKVFYNFGYPSEAIDHGSIAEIEKHHRLDGNSIAQTILKKIKHL